MCELGWPLTGSPFFLANPATQRKICPPMDPDRKVTRRFNLELDDRTIDAIEEGCRALNWPADKVVSFVLTNRMSIHKWRAEQFKLDQETLLRCRGDRPRMPSEG